MAETFGLDLLQAWVIHWAALLTRCSCFFSCAVRLTYHTVHPQVRTLSCAAVEVFEQRWGVFFLLSVLRKKRRCWAFLIMWVVFTGQPGSSEMCRPKNLKFLTCSTSSPLVLRHECSLVLIFLKSKMISFLVLRLRWLSPHQATSAWTSSLPVWCLNHHC